MPRQILLDHPAAASAFSQLITQLLIVMAKQIW
jgi:hypothetical protein